MASTDLSLRHFLDRVGVSIWLEDFSAVRQGVDRIRASAGGHFRRYFQEHPDFVDRMIAAVRVTDVNAASVLLFEAESPEQLLASLETIFLPDTRDVFLDELVCYAEGARTFSSEVPLRSVKGSRLRVHMTLTFPRPGDPSDLVVASLLDVSHRALTEESRRRAEREENLRRLIAENATLGLFMMDARHRCTYMNEAAEQITGFSFADMQALDRPLHDIIHHTRPDGRPYPREECPIDRALPTRNRETGEDVFVRRDGTFYPVAFTASPIVENGVPVGTVIEVRDTTEERRVQRQIREAKERLQAALDASSVGTYFWDIQSGHVSHDEGIRRLFGLTVAEAGDLVAYTSRVHPDDRERWRLALDTAATRGDDVDLEYRVVWPDGSTHWLLDKGKVVRDAGGRPMYLPGAVVDITQQKRAEEALRDADRRKDEFLAILSHELRTPLNAILGWTAILLGGAAPPDRLQRALGVISRNARLQARLIEDVLDVASVTSGRFTIDREGLDLVQLTRAVVESFGPEAALRGITPEFEGEGRIVVAGDAARLQQVVGNVLSNALRFTPTGGSVRVAVGRDAGAADVIIQDSGPGIPEDFLPHAFERFRQADSSPTRAHSGLGIGLALARHIVDLHGGSIAARNLPRPPGGLEVSIRLPLSTAKVAERDDRRPPESPGADVSLAGTTVLVVDDATDLLELAETVLATAGATVISASSPADALDRAVEHRPHVAVLDIGLPGIDGIDLLRPLRELEGCAALPAIAISGYSDPAMKQRARDAGFALTLTKPVAPRRLLQVVHRFARVMREAQPTDMPAASGAAGNVTRT